MAGLLNSPTLSAYNPTWRDRLATMLMGDGKASPERRQFVGGLMGSTGLGATGAGVVDATPVGGLLAAQEAYRAGDPKGMALAMLPMPGARAAAGAVERAASEVAPAVKRGIIAYHGSPHSFDKFDMSKIGTGEGAQAYGHGLYFAEAEPVAQEYRQSLSGVKTKAGDTIKPDWSDPEFLGLQELRKHNFDFAKAREAVVARATKENWPEQIAAFDKMAAAGVEPTAGSMYQVRINADPEHFLDWDKPLSEQSPVVRQKLGWTPEAESQYHAAQSADDDALLAALEDRGNYSPSRIPVPAGLPPLNAMGADIARGRGVFDRASDVDRAAMLREAGIPGIKYLDQGSRSAGEGSRNYVVFDDKLVDILRKYGIAGLLGGGAAMGAAKQGQNGGPQL